MEKNEIIELVMPLLKQGIFEDMVEWEIGTNIEECIKSFNLSIQRPKNDYSNNVQEWVDEVGMEMFEEMGVGPFEINTGQWIHEICPTLIVEMRDYLVSVNRDNKISKLGIF